MDLEHKLTIAKEELEKTALDKVSTFFFNRAALSLGLEMCPQIHSYYFRITYL